MFLRNDGMSARKKQAITIALVFTALSWTRAYADFSGKVIAVKDGDTLKVLRDSTTAVTVRLYGIDCPERGQAFSLPYDEAERGAESVHHSS